MRALHSFFTLASEHWLTGGKISMDNKSKSGKPFSELGIDLSASAFGSLGRIESENDTKESSHFGIAIPPTFQYHHATIVCRQSQMSIWQTGKKVIVEYVSYVYIRVGEIGFDGYLPQNLVSFMGLNWKPILFFLFDPWSELVYYSVKTTVHEVDLLVRLF